MIDVNGLIIEYEMILCGERKTFYMIGSNTTQDDVVIFLRYVFEEIVGWSPEQLRDLYTDEIAKKLHIERVIEKIAWPVELDRKKDFFYVAVFLYPDRITYNKKERIIQYYLNSYLPDEKIRPFFETRNPELYIEICAGYMLEQEFGDAQASEIYEFFAKKKSEYMPMLKRYKLNAACSNSYQCCLDMIHRALPPEKRNDELYTLWRFIRWIKDNQISLHVDRKKRERSNIDEHYNSIQ